MANYAVTTLDDETFQGTETTGTPDGNGLSLREALALANGNAGADTITFAAGLAGGTLLLTNGELTISSDVTIDGDIDGNGTPDITIDANDASRVLVITAGTTTLDGLVIQEGFDLDGFGGGVSIAAGAAVTITHSTVQGNDGIGGGIWNDGTATLISTAVSENRSTALAGGGIFNNGTMTIVDGVISGNLTFGYSGGGITNFGTLTLVNSTVNGNVAGFFPIPPFFLPGDRYGGGISNFGDATLINSTVSGNIASTELLVGYSAHGGGIYNAENLTLINTIVAGNDADDAPDIANGDTLVLSGGNIIGATFSIDGVAQPGVVALTDVFAAIDPNTGGGELADNGGPVRTIALAASSANPAINAGDPDQLDETQTGTDLNGDGDQIDVITTDARGEPRSAFGAPDLGAFEVLAITNLVVTTLDDELDASDTDLATADPNDLSLREALAIANGDPDTNVITFDAALTGGTTAGVDNGVITLGGTELVISSNVTIDGDVDGDGDAGITVSGNDASRVFNISSAGSISVTLNGLDIRDGNAANGGGINVTASETLNILNSTLSDNQALDGGGGILNNGTLRLLNSTLSGNSAGTYGGGIFNTAGTVILTNTTLSGNSAADDGGGILNDGGTAILTNATLSGNSAADDGGGLFNDGGDLTLTNSIVAGNGAAGSGDDIQDNGTLTKTGANIIGDTFFRRGCPGD